VTGINYHHLKVFAEVARCRNITAAAAALRVAQSAVSVQVRALEASLGVRLFEREAKSLRLTPEGRMVADYADEIFSLGGEMRAALLGLDPGKPTLRVGATATLSRNFQMSCLQPLLGRAKLFLKSGSWHQLLEELEAHRLDVVLCNHAVAGDFGGVFLNHLLDEQRACIVGPPRGGSKRFVFPKSLDGVEMVLPGEQSNIRGEFDALMLRENTHPVPVIEVDDMAMLRLLARESGLPALVPRVVVRDELESGQLRELCRVPGVAERFYAVTVRRRFESPLLKELLFVKRKR